MRVPARPAWVPMPGIDGICAVWALMDVGLIDFACGVRWALWLHHMSDVQRSPWTRVIR